MPCDDREVPFLIRARSSDFQEVIVQGAVIYRVSDPDVLATRFDFTIDTWGGAHVELPLDRIAELFTHQADEIGGDYAARTPLTSFPETVTMYCVVVLATRSASQSPPGISFANW